MEKLLRPVLLSVAMWGIARGDGVVKSPGGLMVEFLQGASVGNIEDARPEFGWIVRSPQPDDLQTAFRILVASQMEALEKAEGNLWDSGKIDSGESVNVSYQGEPLRPMQTCYWKVKTWTLAGGEGDWSAPMTFTTGKLSQDYATSRYPLSQSEIAPVAIVRKERGRYFIDFGKVVFGYLRLKANAASATPMEVHFAERGDEHGINRNPGGTVRYYKVEASLKPGNQHLEIRPPADSRNTHGQAVRMPEEIGVVAPFRYVELVNCPVEPTKETIRQVAVHYPFEEQAACFESSDPLLDDIWELCKYSMKATSFCGVYVDGDRERIPYEADAYINQLSHYAVDREYSLARYSHEYLLEHPTWPTEWKQHSVLMAWADFMYTGDTESLARNYEKLKAEKTLEWRARPDGLLQTDGPKNRDDIIDWPEGERDGFVLREVNTVINAFYYMTLARMADMAAAIGKEADAVMYRDKAANVKKVFNEVLFDAAKGRYVDGEGTDHASLHANMMPLAFGLVPENRRKSVTDFVISRGMACSVYGAQYLLEGLYEAGRPDAALALMTSKDVRSWYNMLRVGSTITLEAWDDRFKPNQDWNHAWGAAPGNIIARYLLGVRPLEPGFRKVLIQPQPGSLREAAGKVPTIRGSIDVRFKNEPSTPFALKVEIPANMVAKVGLPVRGKPSAKLLVDGKETEAVLEDGYLFVDGIGSGPHVLMSR